LEVSLRLNSKNGLRFAHMNKPLKQLDNRQVWVSVGYKASNELTKEIDVDLQDYIKKKIGEKPTKSLNVLILQLQDYCREQTY